MAVSGGDPQTALMVGVDDWVACLPVWRRRAACRGSTANFFPGPYESAVEALAVCARCPVVAPCLAHALVAHELGVWGGTTPTGRRRLRRAMRQPTG